MTDTQQVFSHSGTLAESVSLRLAEPDDLDLLFKWQCLEDTRRYARDKTAPSRDQHRKWFDAQLRSKTSQLRLILINDVRVGTIRLDQIEQPYKGYEVSIYVDPEYFRRGVASGALKQIRHHIGDHDLYAWVNINNTASRALFERNHYKPIGDGWHVYAQSE
jgi:UDP-2,4-diacetamido-2,4,6-trideoxy-beta-L-altropyranose hydrolase